VHQEEIEGPIHWVGDVGQYELLIPFINPAGHRLLRPDLGEGWQVKNVPQLEGVLEELVQDPQEILDGFRGEVSGKRIAEVQDVAGTDIPQVFAAEERDKMVLDGALDVLEIGLGYELAFTFLLAALQPGLGIVLKTEGFDFFPDEVPGVEEAAVNAFPDGGKQAVGPFPGVQGIVVPAREDPMPLSLPLEVQVIAARRGLAFPAAQRFSLELATASRAFF
jgi:hypothetical protein